MHSILRFLWQGLCILALCGIIAGLTACSKDKEKEPINVSDAAEVEDADAPDAAKVSKETEKETEEAADGGAQDTSAEPEASQPSENQKQKMHAALDRVEQDPALVDAAEEQQALSDNIHGPLDPIKGMLSQFYKPKSANSGRNQFLYAGLEMTVAEVARRHTKRQKAKPPKVRTLPHALNSPNTAVRYVARFSYRGARVIWGFVTFVWRNGWKMVLADTAGRIVVWNWLNLDPGPSPVGKLLGGVGSLIFGKKPTATTQVDGPMTKLSGQEDWQESLKDQQVLEIPAVLTDGSSHTLPDDELILELSHL